MTSPTTQEIDDLNDELKTAAWQLIATFAAVFLVAFGLGYLTGIN
jgi:hypothetical protein